MQLADVLAALAALPDKERSEVVEEARRATASLPFIPLPGPQTEAYFSKADVLLFGGSPGGGKTALGIGLALNAHHRALVVRKNFVDLDGILHTMDNILGGKKWIGGNRPRYDKADGGVIHFMGMGDDLGGKQGNPHDMIFVDEAAQLPEDQVRMLIGWLRTHKTGQRCRVVMGSNPPLDTTGDWLVQYFAPWLDDRHPNPAQPGELRWFLPDAKGGDRECEATDTTEIEGVTVGAQSRTYIPSKFTDNPYYDPEAYAKSLAGLPDAERDRLISGNFMHQRSDDVWQAIPTAWVKAAMQRWGSTPPVGVPMCSIGVDVAQGGTDNTVLAIRHDSWFAPLVKIPGVQTPGGTDVAGVVTKHRRDGAKVIVDIGGGWGGDAYAHLKANGIDCDSFMGVKASSRRTVDNQLRFSNVRTEAYWRLREALDPDKGSVICLPNDRELLSDLTSPTYSVESGGLKLESKEALVKRLGRSPDKGDAVAMAWYSGPKMADSYQQWKSRPAPPKVVLGHQAARRIRYG